MGQVVLLAGAQRALEDRLAGLHGPGDVQQLLARLGLEFPPELVRAPEERDVVRVLEVREADDPRQPVRRAVLVRDVEALETDDALPAASEVVERRAPHPADADDGNVVALHLR